MRSIQVSDALVLPDDFEEHAEEILQYGIAVYREIGKLATLEGQNRRVEEILEEHARKVKSYEAEYTKVQEKVKYYETLLKEQKSLESAQIHDLIEKGRAQRESEILYLKEELRAQKAASMDDLGTKVLGVLAELQSFNTYVGASSAQKGSVGENIVYNYLSQHFSHYDVQNTSKNNASMSDLFMTSHDQKFHILVEVKNVNTLSASDKTKFIHDIEVSSKSGKIDGAILYSLHNTNINSRAFNIVYHYGIPTLYISNVKSNVEMIKYGVFVMEELIQKKGCLMDNADHGEEHADFVKMVDMMNKHLHGELDALEKDRKQIIYYENQYKERFKRTSSQIDYVKGLMEKHKITGGSAVAVAGAGAGAVAGAGAGAEVRMGSEEDHEAFLNGLIQKIVDSGITEGNIGQTTLAKIGIKGADISKAGGIKNIRTKVKSKMAINICDSEENK